MVHEKTEELKKKLVAFINQNLPLNVNGKTLTIEDISFTEPKELNNIDAQLRMRYLSDEELRQGKGNLFGTLRGKIIIRDDKGKLISQSKARDLIPIPYLTDRGTYIINGGEKNILSQMRLKPGVYTTKSLIKNQVKTNFMFNNTLRGGKYMPQITITFSPQDSDFKITVKGNKETNFNGVNFLRQIGFDDSQIMRMLGNDIVADDIMRKYGNKNTKTINDIYQAITGKTMNDTPDKVRLELYKFLSANATFGTGQTVISDNLGVNAKHLTQEVIAKSVQKTFAVSKNEMDEDDKDDLRYKDVYDDNDFVLEQVEKDFMTFLNSARATLEKDRNISVTNIREANDLGKQVVKFFKESDLVQSPDEINPLFIASIGKKVTQLGTGGISGEAARTERSARNLINTEINRIDPIETPESGNIGLIGHLSQEASIKNRTIYTTVLKVVDGKAEDTAKNKIELSPHDEYNAKVAFYDTRYINRDGNTITFTRISVPCRYKGKITNFKTSEIQYVDRAPQNIMGYAANMIPFVAHNDGNRALMGSNMQKQAIPLKDREAPIVTTTIDPNKKTTYDEFIGEQYGKPVRSEVNGVVDKVESNLIVVKDNDGKTHAYQVYHYFPLNNGFINNEIKVKVGDRIKKGDMLAEGWQTKDGKLALGVNARIGYLAYKGYNYEDGVVVSESFAKKMTTEELHDESVEIKKDWLGGRGSNIHQELLKHTAKAEVKNLDNDGIVKVGTYVKPGMILVGILKPEKQVDEYSVSEFLGGGKKKPSYRYDSITIPPTSYVEGEIKRITVINNPGGDSKQRIIFTLVAAKSLKLGDKIAGRHGNKGTITKILSDQEMPVAEDGRTLDLMFSPLAVPSRKNVGQLLETNAGLLAEKTGKSFVLNNFDHKEKDKVLKGLKDIGLPDGKMKVTVKEVLPSKQVKEVQLENPVTVGNMYIMKLKHKVDDKIQGRSNLETYIQQTTMTPGKRVGSSQGEKHNPQSLGEMEMRALQAHGAVWNILESSTIKSDGGGDAKMRNTMFRAMQTGSLDKLDVPATPQTLNVLSDELKALGFNVKPINNGSAVKSFDEVFDSMQLTPIKPSEMLRIIGKNNEVTKQFVLDAKGTKKGESGKVDEAHKGGLMDPKIFGEPNTPEARTKWGYIKLATPLPNPVFLQEDSYNPYVMLTGINRNKLVSMMKGKQVMIIDPEKYEGFASLPEDKRKVLIAEYKKHMQDAGLKPGQLINPSGTEKDPGLEQLMKKHGDILWKAGGEGLQHILDGIDLNKELEATKKSLDVAQGEDIDKLYKKYRILTSLKENGIQPSDLMLHYVPVTPLYLRPVKQDEDGNTVINSDINKLYGKLVQSNNPLKDKFENGFDLRSNMVSPSEAAHDTGNLYNKLINLTAHEQAIDVRTRRPVMGIKNHLSGKEGLIRDKMLSKRVDFSGRSVIGVDPSLKINEVGIPFEMARYLYRPFIIKELVARGMVKNESEAEKKWEKEFPDKDMRAVLEAIAKERPVLLNRQPSLHKFSIQAFKPIIKDKQEGEVVRSIHLNPMVVTGFNADFDGDTMATHVPITERAREEALRLMMPSQNLINPTNGSMILEIRHEMALGIYYLTMNKNKPTGKGINYGNDYSKLRKDYRDGIINANTKVSCGDAVGVAAGQAMFNLLLPKKYRAFDKVWDKNAIGNMLLKMYQDGEANGWKTTSKLGISNVIDKIKELGFESATRSGISIGVGDFKHIDDATKIFANKIEEAKKEYLDEDKALVMGWRAAEKEIEKKLKKGMVLEEDNPIQIMMASGARAKPDQIRRMMVSVGVGVDVTNKLTQPVKHSHLDGLAPQEYWLHSYDARKGLFDRSVSTQTPGELTRQVWSATQDMVIKEHDCYTSDGIELPKNNSTVTGRVAAESIIGKSGVICKKGQMITIDMRNKIYDDETIKNIKVRSPLRCKTVKGICQKCYGAVPGTMQYPKIGDPVGVIASQAMGEPVMQMTMNTFHSGGTSSSASLGVERVKQILGLNAGKENVAVLATVSGKVTDIKKGSKGTFDTVLINNVPHKIPHFGDGESKKLRVKVGDQVTKGDFLTLGNIEDMWQTVNDDSTIVTNAKPQQLFDLLKGRDDVENPTEKALGYTKDYLAGNMEYVFDKTVGPGTIDRRHIETVINKLTSKVKVLDPGDSKYIKGQVVEKNEVDKWNAENATPLNAKKVSTSSAINIVGRFSGETYKDKAGKAIITKGKLIDNNVFSQLLMAGYKNISVIPRPAQYNPELYTRQTVVTQGHDNWFSNLGHQDVYEQIARGGAFGQVDKLEDPRARVMSGKLLRIGEGYNVPKGKANGMSTKMLNFFSGMGVNKKKK